MNLSRPFVLRPIGTSLLAAGVLLLGFAAYLQLPVAPLPQVDLPFIFVTATEPGASPQTMASTVATPLERRLGAIAGVSEIISSSKSGNTGVVMQFDPSRSVDGAARDVQAGINAAAPDLPSGLPTPPTYHKANPSDAPILILALMSPTRSVQDVYTLADTLVGQRIRQLKGVSEVDVAGGANPSVRIDVNPAQVASLGLTLDDVRNAVVQSTDYAPKGAIDNGQQRYMITANDQLLDASTFDRIIVGTRNGTPIRLSEVATIEQGQENDLQAAWFNNQRAVLILIRKQADANVIQTADAVKALLPSLQRLLPPDTTLTLSADRTQTIRASVNEVQITLLISLTLVVMVMFLFLRRLTPTFIAAVTVPLAIAATFGVMWLAGFSLDNLSLMALTISVGFVVDDAIVVIENIVRHLERGEPPLRAALNGAREIGFTVLSMSLSLIAVFIPLLFMSGILGTFFIEFSATLTIAIAASMVVSLTLTPSLCGRFLRNGGVDATPGRLSRAAERIVERMQAAYRVGLDWALVHRWTMAAATVGSVVLTLYLYTVVPKGLFPQQDTGLMMGSVVGSSSISFDAMSTKLQQVSAIVLRDPAVANVSAYTGGSGYQAGTNRGNFFVTLKPRSERGVDVNGVINRLRPKMAHVLGVSAFLRPVEDFHAGGRTTDAQYVYALRADNLEDLYTWAPKLVAEMKKNTRVFGDVSSDLDKAGPEADIIVNRDAASRLGISMAAVDDALNNAFAQRQVATLYDQRNEYHVVLGVDPNFQVSPADFDHIYLDTGDGTAVPLSTVAHLEYGLAPLTVQHDAGFPVVNISYNLAEGAVLGDVQPAIDAARLAIRMPDRIRGGGAGNFKLFAQSMSQQPLLILAALLTIYVVLGMLYESLIHPITILSTLPSAGLGALLALIVCGSELDVVSIIGVILLMGIVKKNAILMIDFALDAERRLGLPPERAIYEACLIRFRPIVMTSLAAMLGAVPLAVGIGTGSELRVPLGIAIIGGLLVSQFLTLFTTPVFYLAFTRLSRWARTRRRTGVVTA